MNFIKLFAIFILFSIFSFPAFSVEEISNSLSQIIIDKPIDNNYRLSLYFKETFNGNAFIQKVKNGLFFVYIPDTHIPSKDIKLIYSGKAKKADVGIKIEEQPFIKENSSSKYIRLAVETPVNSDIQLLAQTIADNKSMIGGNLMSIYSVIIALLFTIAALLSISIYRAMRSIDSEPYNYTTFPPAFLNSPESYAKNEDESYTSKDEISKNAEPVTKPISPISKKDFKCFDLPIQKEEEVSTPISSAIAENVEVPSLEERTIQAGMSNPVKQQAQISDIEEDELELPVARRSSNEEEQNEQSAYNPELISELKIAPNKGFYLTSVGDNTFALFGYVFEKVFFLQKFKDLTQINLQARFYDKKGGNDLYIIKLDSYKAMLAVSDTEIKELAVI